MAGSNREKVVRSAKPQRLSLALVLAACAYTVWFAWLAYVAWVNVSAGNQ